MNRIEGQVRGVKKMLEEDRYCVDILTQVSAINSALNSFNKVLLAEHIKSCVVDDIRAGKEEAVDELCATLQKTDEIEEDKSVKQERYEVTGMTCSACSSRVEKCVSKI